jgi:ribonuclease P protein component
VVVCNRGPIFQNTDEKVVLISGLQGNNAVIGNLIVSRHLFRKSARIQKRIEFIKLSENGRKLKNEHFIAVIGPGEAGTTRLGITVTKKIGCAVIRNRIKRFIREYFRLNRHRIMGRWDISIIARKRVSAISSKKVFSSLGKIFDDLAKNISY